MNARSGGDADVASSPPPDGDGAGADVACDSDMMSEAVGPGALAGIVGGAAFGAAMIDLGSLETIASLARSESVVVGFVIHFVIAIAIGVGFGLLVRFQRPGVGETLFWGMAYGAVWWFVGAVTLLPLLSGEPLAWSVDAARSLVPSLIGHLVYGAFTALGFVVFDRRSRHRVVSAHPTIGSVSRGAIAGLFGGITLALILDAQPGRPTVSSAMTTTDRPLTGAVTVLVGVVAGIGFALLHPNAIAGSGPALVRGMVYGFLAWIVLAVTVVPLASGDGLTWTVDDLRDGFATLPGYLLFIGAVPALVYQWLTSLTRAVASDRHAGGDQEGVGTQGLRAIFGGAAAGIVGGTVFSIVIVRTGDLPGIASMVAVDSPTVGLVLHLVTSVSIGVGYGVFFVKRSNDVSSALGWGISYGVFWWLMGSLTLLPVLAGGSPQWNVEASSEAFPSLVGHLAYGAFLGMVFYRLEARYDPWWVSRNAAEERRARRAADQLAGSAPALWVLTVLFAVVIPILLAPA